MKVDFPMRRVRVIVHIDNTFGSPKTLASISRLCIRITVRKPIRSRPLTDSRDDRGLELRLARLARFEEIKQPPDAIGLAPLDHLYRSGAVERRVGFF